MHHFRFLSAFCVLCLLSVVGCGGGSDEPTTISTGELQNYVTENAAVLADEDAIADMEDEDEDEDEDE